MMGEKGGGKTQTQTNAYMKKMPRSKITCFVPSLVFQKDSTACKLVQEHIMFLW